MKFSPNYSGQWSSLPLKCAQYWPVKRAHAAYFSVITTIKTRPSQQNLCVTKELNRRCCSDPNLVGLAWILQSQYDMLTGVWLGSVCVWLVWITTLPAELALAFFLAAEAAEQLRDWLSRIQRCTASWAWLRFCVAPLQVHTAYCKYVHFWA